MIIAPTTLINHGDQRRVFIQTIINKRRRKRKGKERKKSKLPLEERVLHVLNNGEIIDYTHPNEVDPFWDVLYRQYEYLCYLDISYRTAIKNYMLVMTPDEYEVVMKDINLLRAHKHKILKCMMNFMFVMYGAVIQSRFYGWKYYIDDFTSKFNEVAITCLQKLRFDPEQTRCSVYFFQAFWLSGLAVTSKISLKLKTYHESTSKLKERFVSRDSFDVSFDEVFEECDIEKLNEIKVELSMKVVPVAIEKELMQTDEEINEEIQDTQITLQIKQKEDQYKSIESNGIPLELRQEWEEENNDDFKVHYILKRLLHKIDIPIDYLYKTTDKSILKIAKLIKQKLANGQLSLNEKEKEILKTVFIKNRMCS